MSDLFWPVVLGFLGAIVGSFLATVALRWPANRSALRGRSACDACGQGITTYHLIPLVSCMLLRGRAACCGAKISGLHWQVELGCAVAGMLAGFVTPGPAGLAVAAFGWLLVLVVALDATEMWIPDALTGAIAISGVLTATILPPPLSERLIGGAAGFGALWGIGFAYRRLRGQEGLGGADPKLYGGIGLWLGWRMLPPVLLFAALIGLGIVAWRTATGRSVAHDDAVPFGAYLALAAYPALLLVIGMGA
ncbi:A24 family peptidase [Sphingomonas sp. TZW2008]|uniref:prepilin peptidase n=1 Tax=Sphingomonas sp. TZW2008 TaxID=1917973 RepID=UPI000A268F5D|nr:A24 family peptidase [Sphingomonas sp. TZW2008]